MTKMRVHELAKELGMDNKELADILQKKNVEIKNHMSTIEDNVADEIRREVSQKGEKKAPSAESKGGEHTEEQAERKEAAPKKKNLAFVIRPQNSRNSSRIQGNRPAQRQARPGQQGTRPGQAAARPARGSRPAGDRPVRPERAAHGARPAAENRPAPEPRPSAERPAQAARPARADRPGQQGRPAAEGRPSTERSAQNARPEQGAHGNRQADGRDNRNMSDRPARGER